LLAWRPFPREAVSNFTFSAFPDLRSNGDPAPLLLIDWRVYFIPPGMIFKPGLCLFF